MKSREKQTKKILEQMTEAIDRGAMVIDYRIEVGPDICKFEFEMSSRPVVDIKIMGID